MMGGWHKEKISNFRSPEVGFSASLPFPSPNAKLNFNFFLPCCLSFQMQKGRCMSFMITKPSIPMASVC